MVAHHVSNRATPSSNKNGTGYIGGLRLLRCVGLALPIVFAATAHGEATFNCEVTATYTVLTPAVANVFGFATFSDFATVPPPSGFGDWGGAGGASTIFVANGIRSTALVAGRCDSPPISHSEAYSATGGHINLVNFSNAIFHCDLKLHVEYSMLAKCTKIPENAHAHFRIVLGGINVLEKSVDQQGPGQDPKNGPFDLTERYTLPPNSVTPAVLVLDPDGYSNSAEAVPEPATFAAFGLAALATVRRRRTVARRIVSQPAAR